MQVKHKKRETQIKERLANPMQQMAKTKKTQFNK